MRGLPLWAALFLSITILCGAGLLHAQNFEAAVPSDDQRQLLAEAIENSDIDFIKWTDDKWGPGFRSNLESGKKNYLWTRRFKQTPGYTRVVRPGSYCLSSDQINAVSPTDRHRTLSVFKTAPSTKAGEKIVNGTHFELNRFGRIERAVECRQSIQGLSSAYCIYASRGYCDTWRTAKSRQFLAADYDPKFSTFFERMIKELDHKLGSSDACAGLTDVAPNAKRMTYRKSYELEVDQDTAFVRTDLNTRQEWLCSTFFPPAKAVLGGPKEKTFIQ